MFKHQKRIGRFKSRDEFLFRKVCVPTLKLNFSFNKQPATFRTESSSVSNNIKFQTFQKYFQNVQLFSINLIKCLTVYTTNLIKTTLIFDERYTVCQWRILKSPWNALKICLFGHTSRQSLSNFEP